MSLWKKIIKRRYCMAESTQSHDKPHIRRSGVKRIIQVWAGSLLQVGILFAAAGTVDWPGAWIYTGLLLIMLAIFAVVLYRVNPELINQRGEKKPDTKGFDKVFASVYAPLILIMPAVAGFDVRYGWSGMPFSLAGIGIFLWGVSCIITPWAMAVNAHFETTVRIQKDRDHTVCTRGPYQYVRHPGYVGMILMYAGTPLILGSWWTFIPAGGTILVVMVRTILEDRILHHELAGYAEYAKTVQYRLLPRVW
jgi:protein-S-isoprenylcysteine O-methyltransferase Ste14